MKLTELVEQLDLQVHSTPEHLDRPVTGGHAGDLLSSVMAHAAAGNVWVTIQIHPNIVAVGALLGLAAIIIAGGAEPEATTLARAADEHVTMLTTPMSAFEVVGKLYQLGVH